MAKRFLLIVAFLSISLNLFAQKEDTVVIESPKSLELKDKDEQEVKQIQQENKKRLKKIKKEEWTANSTYAMLWGIIPGGGQFYNRKYWKLPIVWGAAMSCCYAIIWNNNMYQEYHYAYRDIKSEDPSKNTEWLAFAPKGAKPEEYQKYSYLMNNLKRGNEFYRRNRDFSIVVSILVYGLSILDAYVDAELMTFDISPDLTLNISPCLINTLTNPYNKNLGLGCSISF